MDKSQLVYPPTVPGVMDKELVEVVKGAGFRRFSKAIMSECRKAELTGICLQQASVDAINQTYGIQPLAEPAAPAVKGPVKAKRSDGHKLTYRASCRLSDDEGSELELYIRDDPHYRNKTDLTKALLLGYIKRKRRQYTDRPATAK